MRRISALLIAGVLCGTWGLDVGTAAADTCKQQLSDTAAASTCEGELGWSYDPASRTFGDGSVTASAKANDPYEYKQDYACGANSTNPGSAIGCSKAFDCPTRLDVDGQPMRGVRIVTFRKLKDDPTDPWRPTNTGVCMYTGKTIPMSAVVDAAREHIEKEVGRPSIIAQPPGGVTLVNFTSLFHAPEQTITSLEITDPVQGRISATPQYTWDLGDGITAEGSGHPYDQGVDPKSPASGRLLRQGRLQLTGAQGRLSDPDLAGQHHPGRLRCDPPGPHHLQNQSPNDSQDRHRPSVRPVDDPAAFAQMRR